MNKLLISLLLTSVFYLPQSFAASTAVGVLALTEQPVPLIRGTTLYLASTGTPLQASDYIASDSSTVQIGELAGMRMALGPHTRIYIQRSDKALSIYLLDGWLKLQPVLGKKNGNLDVVTATLELDVSHSASVIHAHNGRVEVFVENGSVPLTERDSHGQAGGRTPLGEEEYLQRKAGKPLGAAGRPGRDFVASMPPAFLDPLPAIVASRRPAPALSKVREVNFDDVATLLLGPLKPDARTLPSHLSPRLADPSFRRAILAHFGGNLDWETELYRFERRSNPH